jgi:hypothetical protein
MKTNLTRLDGLSEDQLRQIDTWLAGLGYRKTAERASNEFNRDIDKASLQRFAVRSAPKDYLDDSPQAQEAAAQILKCAASGHALFTPATIQILEQTAFQLALTCRKQPEDMQALKQISTMLFRHRNTVVRERIAAVQEAKADFKRQHLIMMGTIRPSIQNPFEQNRSSSLDELLALSHVLSTARRENDPSRRDDALPPSTWSGESQISSLFPATQSSTPESSLPDSEHQNGVPDSRRPGAANPRDSQISSPSQPPNSSASPPATAPPASAITAPRDCTTEPSPETIPCASPATEFSESGAPVPDLETSRHQLLQLLRAKIARGPEPDSSVSSALTDHVDAPSPTKNDTLPSGAIEKGVNNPPETLHTRAADYTRRRSEEFAQWHHDHRRSRLGCPSSYRTKFLDCPCGHPLQCPKHPWPPEFFLLNPSDPDYEKLLRDHGLLEFPIISNVNSPKT